MSTTMQTPESTTACAVLPAADALHTSPVPAVPPIVFIDGVMRGDWLVRLVRCDGPLDQRLAVVRAIDVSNSAVGGGAVNRDPPGGVVVIAQPVVLRGGVTRWLPLLRGRFAHRTHRISGREYQQDYHVIDDWAARLNRPLDEPIIAENVQAALDTWRTLAGLSAWAWIDVALPVAVRERTLPAGRLTGRTLGAALQSLLTEHGLRIEHHLTWQGGDVRREVMVRTSTTDRPIRLTTDQVGQSAANLAAIERRHDAPRPVRWIAEAEPRVVESTFELQPAWSPDAMDLPDAQYARSTSDDFEAVAHVFRLWVLNEDGAYSGGAIDLGEPFDLTGLFNDGRPVAPQSLPFGPALTRDPAGRSAGVVVEQSIDGGTTWQRVTDAVRLLNDRAGIRLDDDALPVEWLTANRDGEARLRVTATLRHPEPTRAIRWAGNPFIGPFDTRRVAAGPVFGWRTVLPGSRFYDAVRSGALAADETDDRDELQRWLAERIAFARTDQDGDATSRRWQLTHSGLQLGLRVGDRLTHLGGRYLERAAQPRLVGLVHDFTQHRTVTEWRSP